MGTRSTELTLIAVYHFILAAMLLLTSCVILPISLVVFPFTVDGFGDFFGGLALLGGLLLLTFGVGLVSMLVGFGLLFRRPWARTGAIVLAVLALFAVPIGTIIGILVTYYLSSDEGESFFKPYAPAPRLVASSEPSVGPAPPASRTTLVTPPADVEPPVVEPEPADQATIEMRPPDQERKAEIKPIEPDEPHQS